MKILFIQHTSVLGGSSKSMLELIDNLPKDVVVHILCPSGSFYDLCTKKGIKTFSVFGVPQFDNTRYGCYSGWRWLILLREFFYLPFLFFKIISLRKEKYDIVHINDITQIYSVIFANFFLSQNIVTHCRAMYSELQNLRTKILSKILNNLSKVIIPIDMAVSNTLVNIHNKHIVHNGLSIQNINIQKSHRDTFTVGIVANFQRYKGLLEYIDAANICLKERKLNINFNIYGASYQDSKSFIDRILQFLKLRENMTQMVKDKIALNNTDDNIFLKGFISQPDNIYNELDLHIFPSYLNAAGRPVFEASFYKIPSIVAIDNSYDDAIINNETGLCIESRNPLAIADAITRLYEDQTLLRKMGENSYCLAQKYYNSQNNALEIYNLYIGIIHDQHI